MDYIEIIRLLRLFSPYPESDIKDTHKKVLNYIKTLNQGRITINTYYNEIIVHITSICKDDSDSDSHLIGYRSYLSGIPIDEISRVEEQSMKKGVRIPCGHDVHLTIALGIMTNIINNDIDHQFLFIFQSNNKNQLNKLLESNIMKKYSVDEMYAIHFEPEINSDQLVLQKGQLYVESRELKIQIPGENDLPETVNHSLKRSTELIVKIQALLSKLSSSNQSVIITFRNLHSELFDDNKMYTVLEGSIRVLNQWAMYRIKNQIDELAYSLSEIYESKINVSYGDVYPSVDNNRELYNAVKRYVDKRPRYHIVKKKAYLYGNDFGEFSGKYKSILFLLGVHSLYPLNTPKVLPSEIIIEKAIRLLYFYFTNRIIELKSKKVDRSEN